MNSGVPEQGKTTKEREKQNKDEIISKCKNSIRLQVCY